MFSMYLRFDMCITTKFFLWLSYFLYYGMCVKDKSQHMEDEKKTHDKKYSYFFSRLTNLSYETKYFLIFIEFKQSIKVTELLRKRRFDRKRTPISEKLRILYTTTYFINGYISIAIITKIRS